MAKPKAEQSVLWLGIFSSFTFLTALIFTALFPAMNLNWDPKTADAKQLFHASVGGNGYTPWEERGRMVYQREGCMYCHSQQIRPLRTEMIRYGIHQTPAPAADEREDIYDEPHFLGTKRNGPDLSRIAGKYSDDWQYSHLYNPQQMVPGSIMPAFTWLFINTNPADPSMEPIPDDDCKALVAYLQTLGRDRNVWVPDIDPKTGQPIPGRGHYAPWLSPADAASSQQYYQSFAYIHQPGGARAGGTAK